VIPSIIPTKKETPAAINAHAPALRPPPYIVLVSDKLISFILSSFK